MFICRIAIFLLIPLVTCALAQASNLAINKEEQQARDLDRHMILRTELIAERQKLAEAQTAFSEEETVERAAEVHRRSENIKALQRELAVLSKPSKREPVRLVVKTRRSSTQLSSGAASGAATFWNPYNRAPDSDTSTEFPTTP